MPVGRMDEVVAPICGLVSGPAGPSLRGRYGPD
jgi:hypothetical protein